MQRGGVHVAACSEMKLLGPSLPSIEMRKIEHEERLVALAFLRANWVLVERLRKNLRCHGFATRSGMASLKPVIRKAAAIPMEVFVSLAEALEEARQVVNVNIRCSRELSQPGQKCCGLVNAQGLVGTKCRQHLERQVFFRQGTMMPQVVGGIIRCTNDVHAKLFQYGLRRKPVSQRPVCGLPNPESSVFVK